MKLRKVSIKNYRGIANLELDIGGTTVFIGENNSGKTSVLRAVGACLRELGPRRRTGFRAFDFHLDDGDAESTSAPPITITLTFLEDKPEEWDKKTVGRLNRAGILQLGPEDRACVILRVLGTYDNAEQDFTAQWEFLTPDGDAIQGNRESALTSLQKLAQFFYLAALRDAAVHFDARGQYWRPFLKSGDLPPEKRTQIEAKLKEVNDMVVGSHEGFGKACAQLKRVQEVVPMESENLISVEAIPARLFDMLAKAQIRIEAATGARVPVDRHGEGTQSLAVLLLFSAFLDTWAEASPIIALEEPEAHLHPSAIRALWRIVEQLPGQKLISTHSGDLLSEVPISNVVRLARTSQGIEAFSVPSDLLTDEEHRKLNFHVRRSRGELLFARAWLLVEGETEAWIFPACARVSGIDFHRLGVRIVEYSQSDLGLLVKVAKALGIQWLCVVDDDSGRSKYEKGLKRALGVSTLPDQVCLPYYNIEAHLLEGHYANIYEEAMPSQNREKIKTSPGDTEYIKDFVACFPASKKTRTAALVAAAIERGDKAHISPVLKNVLDRVVLLAGGIS